MRFYSFFIITLISIATYSNVFAQKYYSETGTAIFTSSVPLHEFQGKSENLTGMINLEDQTVDFYLDLETLDTDNGKRDRDMKRTLDTENHPFAEFFGKLITSFDTNKESEQEVLVKGDFTIHGITKEVEIEGFIVPTVDGIHVKANWTLLLSDYEIEPPSLLIIKVDEEQKIEIDIMLEPIND